MMPSDGHASGVNHRFDPCRSVRSYSALGEPGEKLSDQQSVGCFWAIGAERTLGLLRQKPEHIWDRDGHVQVEVKLLLAACLAVSESRVLIRFSPSSRYTVTVLRAALQCLPVVLQPERFSVVPWERPDRR